MVSNILPHPVDHTQTWDKIQDINEWLNRSKNKEQGKYETWKTDEAFTHKRCFRELPQIKDYLFAGTGRLTFKPQWHYPT